MYRCENCHVVVPPNQPQSSVVVETRPRLYENIKPPVAKAKRRPTFEPVSRSAGYEIAKELRVCSACAAILVANAAPIIRPALPEPERPPEVPDMFET